MPEGRPNAMLSTRETRRFLSDYVRKRVGEQDVDDVVQTVLVDALAAQRVPEVDSELRRWLIGIARHKIADHHRKAGREQPAELPDLEASAPPLEERQMASWAERQAPASKEAARTLEWMAREGEGEKLEQIAIDEQVAAATVRQRVSRMRRWMRERWLAELAAVAALGLLAFALWRWLHKPPVPVTREPPPALEDKQGPKEFEKGPPQKMAPSPVERARDLRRAAAEDCSRADYAPCLQKLDEARDLDPAGDRAPEIQELRAGANAAQDEKGKQLKKKSDVEEVVPQKGTGTPPSTTKPPPPPLPNPKTGPGPEKAPPGKKPTKASSFEGTPSGIDSAIVLGGNKTAVPPQPPPSAAPQQAAFPQQPQQQAFRDRK